MPVANYEGHVINANHFDVINANHHEDSDGRIGCRAGWADNLDQVIRKQ
jgi:hypothetical protein